MASQNGHSEVVRLLLESRADANLADKVRPLPRPERIPTESPQCGWSNGCWLVICPIPESLTAVC